MKQRLVHNNGFKDYYYVCQKCNSEHVLIIAKGGFQPPMLKCGNCGFDDVLNTPITIPMKIELVNSLIESERRQNLSRFERVKEILNHQKIINSNIGTLLHLLATMTDKEVKNFHEDYLEIKK